MFTQANKTNISRCNGCKRKCRLGAQAVILYDNHINFRPTINNQPVTKYIDKNGRKRFVTAYFNKQVALSFARTVSKSCRHYQEPVTATTHTLPDTQCHGCECKCSFGAQHIKNQMRDGYLPVIGTKTVSKYTNKRGITNTVPYYDTQSNAIRRAERIAKLCDHYQR